MTLRARLALGFVAIAAVLLLPLVVATRALDELRLRVQQLSDSEVAASLLLGRVRSSADELRRAEVAMLVADSAAERREYRARAAAELDRIRAMTDTLLPLGLEGERFAIRRVVLDVDSLITRESGALDGGQQAVAFMLSSDSLLPRFASLDSIVASAAHVVDSRTAATAAEAIEAAIGAQRVSELSFAAALVLATLIAIGITAMISRPVRDLQDGMRAIADGDLAHRLSVAPARSDEFGRLAESYQQMARQLRELEKMRAELLSIASHELKTPINVISGYMQLLQEDVYGPLTPEQREICATLGAQAASLARLVHQLLDASRFEAGGGRLEARALDLPAFLDEMERSFRALALQKGIRFLVSRGDDLPAEVTWDHDRISEVIGNLLSNAFKFTPRGGSIALEANAHEGQVLIDVRDTGTGIAPEQLPFIFEKFYQADNQHAVGTKGTGLGLAIAKGIVEAHGGTISVESTVGVGTSFSLALPLQPPQGPRPSADRGPASAPAPARTTAGVAG